MRPISNLYFGPAGPVIIFHNGSSVVEGYIIRQIGSTRYHVTTDGTSIYTVDLAAEIEGTTDLIPGQATMIVTPFGGTAEFVSQWKHDVVTVGGNSYEWTTGVAEANYARFKMIGDAENGGGEEPGGGSGETPAWVPENAVGYADFSSGNYYAGGQVVALTDFLGSDPDVAIFNPDDIIPGEGYVSNGLTGVDRSQCALIGPALEAMMAGGVMVVEFTAYDIQEGMNFSMVSKPAPWQLDYYIGLGPWAYMDDASTGATQEDVPFEPILWGWNAVAMTFKYGDYMAMSMNGNPVKSVADLSTVAEIGGMWINPNAQQVIKRITIYPARPDTDLPILAARPTGLGDPEARPVWMPENAVAYGDFVNGNYYAGDQLLDVKDFIGTTSAAGTYNPINFVEGEGFKKVNTTNPGVALMGLARDTVLAGGALVIEFTVPAADTGRVAVDVIDSDDWNIDYNVQLNLTAALAKDSSVGGTANNGALQEAVVGLNRAAMMFRHGDAIAVSINGNATILATPLQGGYPLKEVYISLRNGHVIKSVTVYDSVPDADLALLSALA